MKQVYMKPRMIVERFALTQSIAAGCGKAVEGTTLGTPTNTNEHNCVWDVGGVFLFLDSNSKCKDFVPSDGKIFGYCYNNPADLPAFFAST